MKHKTSLVEWDIRPGDKSSSRHLLIEKFSYRFLVTLIYRIYESMGFTGQIGPF